MNFRNGKPNSKKASTKRTKYIDLPKVDDAVDIENGEMWLKSGKYESVSVSVRMSEDATLSDWMRKITLRNVVLTVEENDRGYAELVISGQNDAGQNDAGDLPF